MANVSDKERTSADLSPSQPREPPRARLQGGGHHDDAVRHVRADGLDRFHLVADVIDRVPKLGARAAYAKQAIRDKLIDHKRYIARHGDDMPEISGWRWGQQAPSAMVPSTEADNV